MQAALPIPKSVPGGTSFVAMSGVNWDETFEPVKAKETALINDLADRTKTATYDSFMKLFEEYLNLSTVSNRQNPMAGSKRKKNWKNLQDYSENEQKTKNKQNIQALVCILRLLHRIWA